MILYSLLRRIILLVSCGLQYLSSGMRSHHQEILRNMLFLSLCKQDFSFSGGPIEINTILAYKL